MQDRERISGPDEEFGHVAKCQRPVVLDSAAVLRIIDQHRILAINVEALFGLCELFEAVSILMPAIHSREIDLITVLYIKRCTVDPA